MDQNDKRTWRLNTGAIVLALLVVLAPWSLMSTGPLRAVAIVAQVALGVGAAALLGASVASARKPDVR